MEGKKYNKYWWRSLTFKEQERILLSETREPFPVQCIKDIFKTESVAKLEQQERDILDEDILF